MTEKMILKVAACADLDDLDVPEDHDYGRNRVCLCLGGEDDILTLREYIVD